MDSIAIADTPDVRVESFLAEGAPRTLADDVLDGLTRPLKELPPKHLYDARGSELFDAICELPEYYPTRAERAILEARSADLIDHAGATELVELGAGSATKTRLLLDALVTRANGSARYVPFDVSEDAVLALVDALAGEYPGLSLHGVVGDFERHLGGVPAASGPRVVAFLGGTIGNFTPGARRGFLRKLAALLGPDDRLLIGVDLVKDPRVLVAAYDDAAGVTAAFNKNMLEVLNRELGGDFDLEAFDHVALWDTRNEWIEMRLRARWAFTARLEALELDVPFAAGEELRTEVSAKFTRARVERDYAAAGLALDGWYTDPLQRFALTLARPAAPDAA